MPSKKRKVTYSENTEPDGDRNVEVSEEQSVNNEDTTQQSNQQNTDEEEEQQDEKVQPKFW